MPLQDEDLARRAAAGDHAAFAELYDRYERRAYNLCYRITGSADDAADATQETFLKVLERLPKLRERELNFAAYVMTAARNASYDVIERRKRATPTSEFPEVASADDHDAPERAALRDAHQEQIRLANLKLPERQREVLALRELSELSYDEVARIMGMNQNSVAQLISRARINLRDGLRQTALGSVASASPDCDRALPLLAKHQDGLLEDPWVVEHLMECGACRVRLEAMEEAAVAYRQWILLGAWLREDAAQAAERVNDGWSRRVLAGAAAGLVVLIALVTADLAQSPTREAGPAPEADPVVRVTAKAPAPKPVKRPALPAKKTKTKTKAKKKVVAAPKVTQTPVPEPVVTAQVFAAPEPVAPKPRSRPRRKPVEVPDPPPVIEPTPADVVSTTPEPPAATPDGTSTTPTCPGTAAAVSCPPPPPRTPVVCRTCTLVAPTPTPTPTPRRPVRLVAPGSTVP